MDFLKANGLEYMGDETNRDTRYLRNRIRHELLPYLEKAYNPNAVDALNRLASILEDEENFWDKEVRRILQEFLLEQTPHRLRLATHGLCELHPALLKRMVRHVVQLLKGGLKKFGHVHVEAIARLMAASTPSGQLNMPQGVRVIRDRDEVLFMSEPPEETVRFEYDIPGIQTTFIPEIGISLRVSACSRSQIDDPKGYPMTTALFDAAAVSFPLKARNFRQGDRFKPLGMVGSQKVKSFFINHKVPRSERLRCPILVSGERIIWVGGYRIDDSVKITRRTKKVLKAELLPDSIMNRD